MNEETASGRSPRLFAAALWLAVSAVLSRVLGFGREAVMSRMLGVSPEVDAYRAAFLVPDMLFYFLAGGAIGIAFIPLYTRMRRDEGEDAASQLLAVVLGTTLGFAAFATLGLFALADVVVPWIYSDFSPEHQALTVRLTRIVLPAQLCFIAGGVIRGALMARGHFAAQAVAPLLYNAGIIAGGLLLGGRLGAEGFAWGALLGAVAGPLLASVVEARRVPEIKLGLRFAPAHRGFLQYFQLALPIMLGLSLLTVDEWYDRYFGQFYGEGAIAALGYARLLLQLPVGIIGQALATAALPFLTRLAAEQRFDALNESLVETLRAGLTLALLAAAAYLALAEPVVALLYQGGRFGAEQTAEVAALLRIFAWAVPAWVVQQIAVRAFYAREDMWRPMALGTAVALAAAFLYVRLGGAYGAQGLAAAGVIGMTGNAIATLVLANRLHGAPRLRDLGESGLRAVAIAAVAGVATAWLPRFAGSGVLNALANLVAGAAVFGAIALAGIAWVGDRPARAAMQRLFRRRK